MWTNLKRNLLAKMKPYFLGYHKDCGGKVFLVKKKYIANICNRCRVTVASHPDEFQQFKVVYHRAKQEEVLDPNPSPIVIHSISLKIPLTEFSDMKVTDLGTLRDKLYTWRDKKNYEE